MLLDEVLEGTDSAKHKFSCSKCEVTVSYPYNLRKHEKSEHGGVVCSS